MKHLNAAFVFTITSSLKFKRNMKKLSFLRKSSPIQAYRPPEANFYKAVKHFQNQRYEFGNKAREKRAEYVPFSSFTENTKSNVDIA